MKAHRSGPTAGCAPRAGRSARRDIPLAGWVEHSDSASFASSHWSSTPSVRLDPPLTLGSANGPEPSQFVVVALACALLIAVPGPAWSSWSAELSPRAPHALASVRRQQRRVLRGCSAGGRRARPLAAALGGAADVGQWAGPRTWCGWGTGAASRRAAGGRRGAAGDLVPTWRSLRTGIVVGASNPKVFLIFAAVLRSSWIRRRPRTGADAAAGAGPRDGRSGDRQRLGAGGFTRSRVASHAPARARRRRTRRRPVDDRTRRLRRTHRPHAGSPGLGRRTTSQRRRLSPAACGGLGTHGTSNGRSRGVVVGDWRCCARRSALFETQSRAAPPSFLAVLPTRRLVRRVFWATYEEFRS
jgi:hypothetical protein